MGVNDLLRRFVVASTPRARERWYSMLLMAQGLTAAATAEALEWYPRAMMKVGVDLWLGRPDKP